MAPNVLFCTLLVTTCNTTQLLVKFYLALKDKKTKTKKKTVEAGGIDWNSFGRWQKWDLKSSPVHIFTVHFIQHDMKVIMFQ